MNTYRVYMTNTVSYYVDVEADSEAEAMDAAEREGLPSLMMLDHRYPDESGWEATEAEEVES
jgi:CheY-like chemotaxis protein